MNDNHLRITACLIILSLFSAASAQPTAPQDILRNNCMACHTADAAGRLSRIAFQRKTPEGWEMTIRRMQLMHHITISDRETPITDDIIRQLVKYLADTQGLAPEESAPYRYILERRLNTVEQVQDGDFAVVCARCHTAARVALQRRTEQEWNYLVHFHLGQFPSAEYSSGGRDRDWFGIAIGRVVPYLARRFPLESASWEAWRRADKPDLAGNWRLVGRMAGKGAFQGRMQAMRTDTDRYALSWAGEFADGEVQTGSGTALVYTGYEWRAVLTIDGRDYQQVLAATADGGRMSGRMFPAGDESTGIDVTAWAARSGSRLLAAIPDHLRTGGRTRVTLVGTGLAGDIDLGAGLTVERVVQRNGAAIILEVSAAGDAVPGPRDLRVGRNPLAAGLTLYRNIDYVAVEPGLAVARVGGNGGPVAPVPASFQALAFSNGPDGASHTADDIRIGYVPAAWAVEPWDEAAARANDVEFAGHMDAASGVFTPGPAGPNPRRAYGTNNVGNLAVVAEVRESGSPVTGRAHLLVTVQRWNNPPIR